MYRYKTRGTCSSMIEIETKDGVILEVRFQNGCSGNLTGLSRLIQGMAVDEAIQKLSGIRCGENATSCPDQLAKALIEMKKVQ